MLQQDILAHPPKILTQDQRNQYFEQGFVLCKGLLDDTWLKTTRDAYTAAIDRSRPLTKSNQWFSVHKDHTAAHPRVLRVERLPDQDPTFWSVARESSIADLASDILGPDVKYRDSMINVKPPGSAGKVAWHQDLAFYPHTNVGTIQLLASLYEVTEALGPLKVVPGSHRREIFEHYDKDDVWTGEISEDDLSRAGTENTISIPMDAGDVIALHPLTVHSSSPNLSDESRPLLIHGMSAADSMSYTAMTWGNSYTGTILRGSPARYAQHDDLHLRLPPDWSKGYTSIFEHQDTEDAVA